MKSTTFFVVSICLLGFGSSARNDTSLEQQCQSQPKDILSKEWVDNGAPEGGWYFPLIYKNVRTKQSVVSEFLHSHDNEKQQSRPFCPRLSWINGVGTLTYYEKKIVYHCIDNSTTSVSCLLWERVIEHTENASSEMEKADRIKTFFTSTDNQSYIFVLRCWEDGHKDWIVVASEKVLSKEVKEIMLDEASSIGFDKEDYYEINYDKCLKYDQ